MILLEGLFMDNELKLFLTISDLAKLSGESTVTWQLRIKNQEVQYVRLGKVKNLRVRRQDFLRWVEKRVNVCA